MWPASSPPEDPLATDQVEAVQTEQPDEPLKQAPPERIDRRWLPDGTALVFSYNASRVTGLPEVLRAAGQPLQLWQQTCGAAIEALGLKPSVVRRISLISDDLASLPHRCLLVIELDGQYDSSQLSALGEPAGLVVFGQQCRRVPRGDWTHPLAIVGKTIVLTGHEDILRHLNARSEVRIRSAAMDALASAAGTTDFDLVLLLDLQAARTAGRPLPRQIMDVWPEGKNSWNLLWDLPDGVGCFAVWQPHLHTQLLLVCSGQTVAERCRSTLDELLAAARSGLGRLAESVGEKLKAGVFPIEVAQRYEELLKQSLAALESSKAEAAEQLVWLKTNWSEAPSALAAAAVDSRAAVVAEWYAAALRADVGNHLRLLGALSGYAKAYKHYPPGAEGGALLPPETRLSWIAQLLPYFDHADWHRQLQFGYPWNSSQNERVTRRALPEVINPAIDQRTCPAGFPVTHYVGVAGVGADAGRLPAGDPRAGMFGYGRTTRPEDLPRGASNTIAIMGVAERLGPWGSGGEATVRALTRRPYVNGPDGFGSGQPDGMLVGMADGSVRFISKDTDPELIERLATLGQDLQAKADRLPVIGPLPPEKQGRKPQTQFVEKPAPQPDPAEKAAPGERGEPGPAEVPARPPAELPDISARLAERLPAVQLERVPLLRAVEVLCSLSTLPISIDTDALAELDVGLDDAVSVDLQNTTVAEVLAKIAESRGLACVVEKTQVLLTSPVAHRQQLVSRNYAVDDLAGDRAETETLGLLVQKLVAPESWQIAGGRGKLEAAARSLAITQTESIHHRITVFLEKLRVARGLPLRSSLDREQVKLQTCHAAARPLLQRELTVNFRQPAPLAEVLAFLAYTADAQIVMDHAALASAGITAAAKASVAVSNQPLAVALRELLTPLGLAYRVVDQRTIEITSRQALASRLELEFYPVRPLVEKGHSAAELMETIRRRVAPATWNDAGGPAALYFDKSSACLIVLQSQPAQVAIEQLLADLARQ